MDSISAGPIIVGVTGAGQETAALKYAAARASRSGGEVVLVHVYPTVDIPPPPSILLTSTNLAEIATSVVDDARSEFEELTKGTVPVRTEALAGSPAGVLVDMSVEAQLIVVQHRRTSVLERIFVGSTAARVAGRAACPVLSVTSDWSPRTEPDGPLEIVAGVHDDGGPRQVLEAAFVEADATGAPLLIVNAWRLDPAYDGYLSAEEVTDWQDEQERHLATAVIDLKAAFPAVSVRIEAHHQWPIQCLTDLSESAGLIVIGRHKKLGWMPDHLGSVARSVLYQAASPVMVVPLGTPRDEDDARIEFDEEIAPQA